SDQKTGIVVAQHPAGGTKVDKGSSVTLNVSKGPAKPVKPTKPTPVNVTVPNVVGRSVSSAEAAITAAGLAPSTQHVPSNDPKDTVVSQSPAGGSSASKGAHVLLNVSDGPAKATPKVKPSKPAPQQQPATEPVPSVVGEDQDMAISDIESAGFV